jgi:hypothetical protein
VAVRREANGYSFGKYLSAAETTVGSNETITTICFYRQNTQAKTVGPPKKRCLLQLATAAYQALLVDINRSRKDQIKIILKDKRSVVKIAKKNGMLVAREAQLGLSFGQKEKFVSNEDIKQSKDDLDNIGNYGDNRSLDGADDDKKSQGQRQRAKISWQQTLMEYREETMRKARSKEIKYANRMRLKWKIKDLLLTTRPSKHL